MAGLAVALAIMPVSLAAQGMGLNASDGEAFLNAVKDGDGNSTRSQPSSMKRP